MKFLQNYIVILNVVKDLPGVSLNRDREILLPTNVGIRMTDLGFCKGLLLTNN